jgi:hypothetical protein
MGYLFNPFHIHVRNERIIDFSAIRAFEIGQMTVLLFFDFVE